jgi:hypothetical protein
MTRVVESGSWWQRTVVQPFRRVVVEGSSPSKLALSMAVGAMIGIWPVPWTSTAACAVLGPIMRLSLPALMFANFMVTSLQLLLLIPFLQAGAWLFRAGSLPYTAAQVKAILAQGVGHTLAVLGEAIARAFAVWLLVTPFAVGLLYLALKPMLERVHSRLVAQPVRTGD